MMYEQPIQPTSETVKVLLDGQPIALPPERRSLGAIRTYLETLALENQRMLCSWSVDGLEGRSAKNAAPRPANCADSAKISFSRIEARTVSLNEMPLRMLETALQEAVQARIAVEAAVTLVLINDGAVARELWWDLARKLKEPLLTLSLLPETIYQPAPGCASLQQLRVWQLQQLATIIQAVDEACWQTETAALSNALENRALPWLNNLYEMIRLWQQTVQAGVRLQLDDNRDVKHHSFVAK
jgi:hypothetical protein